MGLSIVLGLIVLLIVFIVINHYNKKNNRKWREKDGVIYFSVTSNGKTGQEWIEYFKNKNIDLSSRTKEVLLSPDFQPTNGYTYNIAVLRGRWFINADRYVYNIRADADKRGFTEPNAEVACLIRVMFTDEELKAMGLWEIVTMHEPINDADGYSSLILARRSGDDGCLSVCSGGPRSDFDINSGFAFEFSETSSPS